MRLVVEGEAQELVYALAELASRIGKPFIGTMQETLQNGVVVRTYFSREKNEPTVDVVGKGSDHSHLL